MIANTVEIETNFHALEVTELEMKVSFNSCEKKKKKRKRERKIPYSMTKIVKDKILQRTTQLSWIMNTLFTKRCN